jgi:hypothetical protein
MSYVTGLSGDSPFVELVGDIPVSTLLGYVHDSWLAFATVYMARPPSFQKRNEPQLTHALAVHLRQRQDNGEQPFAGEFLAEVTYWDLDVNGLPKCTARTDIEWRLYGAPVLTVEFKILDGKRKRRVSYLQDGIMRFVIGRYASAASVGAMFALLRKAAAKDAALILVEIEKDGSDLQCTGVNKKSNLLPALAAFDTNHWRCSPNLTPFKLAHIFVSLPL